jgi:lysozyme
MDRARLVEDLKSDEGWRPYVYRDTEGFQTIGYGFLVDPDKPGGMPKSIGEMWLTHNVDQLYRAVRRVLPWFDDRPEPVQRALCNMAYQLGLSGLLGFKNTLLLIERGRYYEAADEALDSLWAKQTPGRAKRVAGLIRSAASLP